MRARRAWVAGAAAGAVAILLLGFAAWQYAMPPDCASPWDLNPESAAHFRRVLHAPAPALTDAAFRAGMLALLAGSFLAYYILCAATVAGLELRTRSVAWVGGGLALTLALLCPAALSPDVYAYVGYARLAVIHHANPYVATQLALARAGDPTAPFLHWPIASPYGPLWTLISMVPVVVAPAAPLYAEVVVMKLIAAAGLMITASAGRRLAERLAPGRGPAAFVAIALNPLFLIEGPGNGHNDLVMTALVLLALVALAEQRQARGLVLVGIGAAIKFVPLLLVPWLVGSALGQRRAARGLTPAQVAVYVAGALVAALGPLAASWAPFWDGAAVLAGLGRRWAEGAARGSGGRAIAILPAATYVLVTAWVLAGRGGSLLARAVTGWVVASLLALVFVAGIWFPWYFAWPGAAALALRDRRGLVVAGLVLCVAAALTLRYAATPPPGAAGRRTLVGAAAPPSSQVGERGVAVSARLGVGGAALVRDLPLEPQGPHEPRELRPLLSA